MEASGNTGADNTYYGVDYREVVANGKDAVTTNQSSAGFGFAFPFTVGNPNLEPETADTWTLGLVINSPIKNIPALSDWRISIDYYTIDITDAIGQQSAGIVMQQCLDPAFNPTFDVDSPFCAGYKRNQTGAIGAIETIRFPFFWILTSFFWILSAE